MSNSPDENQTSSDLGYPDEVKLSEIKIEIESEEIEPGSSTLPKNAIKPSPRQVFGSLTPKEARETSWTEHIETEIFSRDSRGRSIQKYWFISQHGFQNVEQFDYAENSISTTKYTWYSFIPKTLFEQFHRLCNFYFLLIAILQFTDLSPLTSWTGIAPLIFVLSVSAGKELYEDRLRARSDLEINNSVATVIDKNNKLHYIPWDQLSVGDIVIINNNGAFPADILSLSTSEPEGLCYVETANLDGETNLKIRQAVLPVHEILDTQNPNEYPQTSKVHVVVECEAPNNHIYTFDGKMFLNSDSKGNPISLNPKNLMLRGSTLRNTKWLVGIVIFTGSQTKLMQNQHVTPSKQSQMDNQANIAVFWIFIFQIFLCIIMALFSTDWQERIGSKSWYLLENPLDLLSSQGNPFIHFFTHFGSFIIITNVIIPISLYVSIEIVKTFQASLIESDINLYYEPFDKPAKANTSNLNEELGQVHHIFTDKTGTLTQNQMDFLKCSIGGIVYGTGVTEIAQSAARRRGETLKDPFDDLPPDPNRPANWRFHDPSLIQALDPSTNDPNHENVRTFLLFMALCHTVVPEEDEKDAENVIYQAASPDEGAIVYAARMLGFKFWDRTQEAVEILQSLPYGYTPENGISPSDVVGTLRFEILLVLEFNATRKRMSIILREPSSGEIRLMCKGADSVIFERLDPVQPFLESTKAHLKQFAIEGLRTLACAVRTLDPDEYQRWYDDEYLPATLSLENRDEKLMDAFENIEVNLTVIGATGIEDKLQEDVPETAATLAQANMILWILTGDKLETAINIGYACSLLHNEMDILVIDSCDQSEIVKMLKNALAKYRTRLTPGHPVLEIIDKSLPFDETNCDIGLVITADALYQILNQSTTIAADIMLPFAQLCKTVVCCRVSPSQKAMVVNLVKDNIPVVTLAIGDGANDVPMIQAAHIGIGIAGHEGVQAVMASDYAIARFKYLKRLLLWHGRNSYNQTSRLILYSFYKNMVSVMGHVWYGLFNGFSAQTLYNSASILVYNVFYTGAPIMVHAVLDQDIPSDVVLQWPELYFAGQNYRNWNTFEFVKSQSLALCQSLIIFFITVQMWVETDTILGDNGQGSNDALILGSVMSTIVVWVVNLKLFFFFNYITYFHHFFLWGSILLWYITTLILSNDLVYTAEMYGVFDKMIVTPVFYFIIIVGIFAALFVDLVWKYRTLFMNPPLPEVVIRALAQKGEAHRDPSEYGSGRIATLNKAKTAEHTLRHMESGFAFEQDKGQAKYLAAILRRKKKKHAHPSSISLLTFFSRKVSKSQVDGRGSVDSCSSSNGSNNSNNDSN